MNVAWWCSATPGQVWVWRYTPIVGVWLAALVLGLGFLAVHRRAGVTATRRDALRFALGVAAIVAVSEWPIGQLGTGYLATVGVARWVIITFVAAPLIVTAIPTAVLDRLLPVGGAGARRLAVVTRWPVALVLFNVVLLASHLPLTIDTLKTSQLGAFTVDVAHLAVALLWWWPALRREPDRGALTEPSRAFYLFASSVLMFVPAAFLTFSPLPLYGLYELAPPLWLGYDAVADQQLAGITMNVVGGLVLWVVIGVLFLGWAGQQAELDAAERRARGARLLRPPAGPPAGPPGSDAPPR